jgi:conjugative transposon TraM protein
MKPHSQRFLQQRRFYMMLPVLVLPFLTAIFWALGGGQGIHLHAQEVQSGFNFELPDAHFDKNDEHWNKFALYEQAQRDSLRYEQARRSDPYYVITTLKTRADTVPENHNKLNASLGNKTSSDQLLDQEQRINQKLQQLTHRLNHQEVSETTPAIVQESTLVGSDSSMGEDIARLEKMMSIMAATDTGDPELQQIDGMLDKILDIQYPDRVTRKFKEQEQTSRKHVLPMTASLPADGYSTLLLDHDIVDRQTTASDSVGISEPLYIPGNRFFGLDDNKQQTINTGMTIRAVIHDTQTVTSGASIKMRMLSDAYIGEYLVPKDHFIYGICTISGERLAVSINAIRLDDVLLPVGLQVYDLDGQEGIYIPEAITGDAARQASTQSVQNMGLYSLDNSLADQAVTAGVEAAKGLFSKKMKLMKVTVKAGYQLLLKDARQLQ